MASPAARLQDESYLNWLRDSLALLLLKEGLEDFTDRLVSDMHSDIHQCVYVQLSQQQMCSSCTYHELEKRGNTWVVRCPLNVCNIWTKEILKNHIDCSNIVRTNLKPTLWPTHPWEVAKCFLPRGCENVTCAGDADVATCLLLFKRCYFMLKFFPDGSLLQEVLEVRHRLMHSSTMTTSDNQLHRDTDHIIQLLNSLVGLTSNESQTAQRTIDSINKLRDKTIDVTLNREVVVLTSKMHAVESELASLGVRCSEFEKFRHDLTTTADDLLSLGNEYRQTKAELDELKKTKDIFEEFLQKNTLIILDDKFDRHDATLSQQAKLLGTHDERLYQIDRRFVNHEQRLFALEESLGSRKLESELDEFLPKTDVDCDIKTLHTKFAKRRLKRDQQDKSTYFPEQSKKVIQLEKQQQNLIRGYLELGQKQKLLKQQLDSDREEKEVDRSRISTLENKVVKIEQQIQQINLKSMDSESNGEEGRPSGISSAHAVQEKGDLKSHMERLNKENRANMTHQCTQRDASFPKLSQLKHHQRINGHWKKHNCDMCGKLFTRKDNLDQHKKKHVAENYVHCDECGQAFSLAFNLNRHKERVHQFGGGQKRQASNNGEHHVNKRLRIEDDLASFIH